MILADASHQVSEELESEQHLLRKLASAIASETGADSIYNELIECIQRSNFGDDEDIDILTEIRHDEGNHLGKLLYIKAKYDDMVKREIYSGLKNDEYSRPEKD